MANTYKSAFEPIRRSHDTVPVFDTSNRKTLPVGVGGDYSRELSEGRIVRSYSETTHLIDSEGQPTRPIRGGDSAPRSRRNVLLAAAASLALAATGGALVYVGIKAMDHDHGPDVTPLVHLIKENETNHYPLQDPSQVTSAEAKKL